MELTPPVQRRKRTTVKNTVKDNKTTKSKYENKEPASNCTTKKADIYHPSSDVIREKMVHDLSCDLKSDNNSGDIPHLTAQNTARPLWKAWNTDRTLIEPLASSIQKVDVKKYSYTGLSILRRRNKLTPEEYLDAKAVKAGFRNQYERVLTRYSEAVRLYKKSIFRSAKEKSKMLRRLHGMERYLKEAERLRGCTVKNAISVADNYISCQVEVAGSHI
jgi:hypothetical protein